MIIHWKSKNGLIVGQTNHGRCEACSQSRIGISLLPVSDCWINLCALCLHDLVLTAMPAFASELARALKR